MNDPEVDAVNIATPHRFHFDNAMLCPKAGKPVLCEKPLTVNNDFFIYGTTGHIRFQASYWGATEVSLATGGK